jgi:hypothetical protein
MVSPISRNSGIDRLCRSRTLGNLGKMQLIGGKRLLYDIGEIVRAGRESYAAGSAIITDCGTWMNPSNGNSQGDCVASLQ